MSGAKAGIFFVIYEIFPLVKIPPKCSQVAVSDPAKLKVGESCG